MWIESLIPNKIISKSVVRWLVLFQLTILMAIWFFSPFVFLPTPGATLRALGDLWTNGMGVELLTSLYLNFEAILFATLISLLLAYSSRIPFMRPIIAMIGKLRFLSMAGLTFLFTLMARNGHQLKLYLLVFSVSVFFVTGMADVIATIPQESYDLARTLRMGEWHVLWEIVMLGQADRAFDVIRQNAAIGWMMLTMVEGMSRSEGGIGTLLLDSQKHFHLETIFALQLVILVLGLTQDFMIGFLKQMFCPYAFLVVEKK
jgi:NitT/TauT family transport system permease protein